MSGDILKERAPTTSSYIKFFNNWHTYPSPLIPKIPQLWFRKEHSKIAASTNIPHTEF
jgi:hypothetical protein